MTGIYRGLWDVQFDGLADEDNTNHKTAKNAKRVWLKMLNSYRHETVMGFLNEVEEGKYNFGKYPPMSHELREGLQSILSRPQKISPVALVSRETPPSPMHTEFMAVIEKKEPCWRQKIEGLSGIGKHRALMAIYNG